MDNTAIKNGKSVRDAVDQIVTPKVEHIKGVTGEIYDLKGDIKTNDSLLEDNILNENNVKGDMDTELENVAMLTKVQGKTGMLVDGQISGSPITWKIDTGAKRTFITEDSYYNILPDSRPVLSPVETQFETADGSALKTLGTAIMTFSFHEFCVEFPIIVGGVTMNLLGEDFIKSFRCHWNWDTRSLEIDGANIPLVDNDIGRSSRVISMETILVPAKHEVVVKSRLTRKVCDKQSDNFGVLCPENGFMKKHGLALGRVLVNATHGIIYTRLFNPSCTDVYVYKGTHIAIFVPVLKVGCSIDVSDDNEVHHVAESMEGSDKKLPEFISDMFRHGTEHLTENKKSDEFRRVLWKNTDVFADPCGKPGRTLLGMHSIKLEEDTQIKQTPRRVPLFKRQIQDEITKLEQKGRIEKSCSPWSSPIVLVEKKDKSWRLCTDYWKFQHQQADCIIIMLCLLDYAISLLHFRE